MSQYSSHSEGGITPAPKSNEVSSFKAIPEMDTYSVIGGGLSSRAVRSASDKTTITGGHSSIAIGREAMTISISGGYMRAPFTPPGTILTVKVWLEKTQYDAVVKESYKRAIEHLNKTSENISFTTKDNNNNNNNSIIVSGY